MSVTEALGEGVMVTVAGLIIVFSVLIILMLVMMAMKKIFYKEPEKTETKADEVQKTVSQQEQPPEEQPTEDPNLIAVLAVAVAASLNTSAYNLKIKSYRRIDNNAPAWNRAGLRDAIDSRY